MSLTDQILNSRVTFSINCRSGFVPDLIPKCECWRCRDLRLEPHDEELAAKVAAEADFKWSQVKNQVMEKWKQKLGLDKICDEDIRLAVIREEKLWKD